GLIYSGIHHDRQGRVELLFNNKWVPRINIGEQGSRIEETWRLAIRIATRQLPSPSSRSRVDKFIDKIELGLSPQREVRPVLRNAPQKRSPQSEGSPSKRVIAVPPLNRERRVASKIWQIQT